MNESALLERIVKPALNKCLDYTAWITGKLQFVDPNDNVEISAHYGATHAAASFLIYGRLYNDNAVYKKGVELLESVLERWSENVKLPAFHNDFNNFALCVGYDYIDDTNLQKKIKETVIATSDSNHDTINWLPMRWYVNNKRYEWTSDSKYNAIVGTCREKIVSATNCDGSVEDRIPKGTSFNLQYDISTVATLELLRTKGTDIDLASQIGFLINAVLPDGDINYQGRGCNQIFAWGPWLYLLSCTGQNSVLSDAVGYLSDGKLTKMLNNDNMMLNEYPGKARYLWWDYHYASVYIAHLLFWSILALRDYNKDLIEPIINGRCNEGFHIKESPTSGVIWFEGRKEYLAEKGPSVVAIYSYKSGVVFKGSFGPWQGIFGNRYAYEDVVLKNFFGLIEVSLNKDYFSSRILRRLPWRSKASCRMAPLFIPISVEYKSERICIRWDAPKPVSAIFNAPLVSVNVELSLTADNRPVELFVVGKINNQYGECSLVQSHIVKAASWELHIKFE